MHNKVREPLFHIVKRDTLPWYQAWGIRAIAIVLALLLCALITTLCTHLNPLKVFGTMFSGAFGSPRKIWILGQNLAILLCISLAVTPAFKMRFWNIGAEGQVLAGGLAAAACMICLGDKVPNGLLIVLIVLSGIAAGAVWAVIPAIFKAKWNTNETLFTLMMNYVATQLVAYFIIVWESPKGSGKVGIINQSTEAGWLPQIGGYKYLLTILVVAVLTVLVYIYLNYSKHGYEISVVGERAHRPLCRHQGRQGHRAHDAAVRCAVRHCRRAARVRHRPHDHDHHRRRPGLHGGHGLVAGQVQSARHDPHELPARVPRHAARARSQPRSGSTSRLPTFSAASSFSSSSAVSFSSPTG